MSGGVDSSVAAVLLNRAIGKNLTCIFVDHGMLRKDEFKNVLHDYECLGLNVIGVDASAKFFAELAGVTEPEKKRKIIGKGFIDVFDEEAHKIKDVKWLAQGTIYPDIVESGTKTAKMVKSHHNVGGLPDDLQFELVEPLRQLFKDEVRACGVELGLPYDMVYRQPFPDRVWAYVVWALSLVIDWKRYVSRMRSYGRSSRTPDWIKRYGNTLR